MAAAKWIDTGIYTKMTSDVKRLMVQDGVPMNTWIKPKIRTDQPLGLIQMLMPILIWISGLVLSGITFFIEIIYSRRLVKKKPKVDQTAHTIHGAIAT